MGIRVLDHEIAHKLRIGIPLTVVAAIRALLHNAYDAGATSIQVILSDNGLKSIVVIDNGHGISEDDCKRIAIPYSTSKISTNEDLGKLGGKTLGFRGLDLSRLAEQCSSMKITTRSDACSLAFVVELKGHPSIREFTTGHHNRGTTVTIKYLFSAYPVRHDQALRSKTIMNDVIDMLTSSALARSSVSLRLYQAQELIWSHLVSPRHVCLPNPTLDAAVLVFGTQVSSQGPLIHQSANGYTVDACLIRSGGNLPIERHHKPFITVDGRPLSRTKGIAKALIKCYQRKMKLRASNLRDYSFWWYLEIRCPEKSYDVNVEPEKDDLVFAESVTVEGLWDSALEGSIVKAQDSSVRANRAEVRCSKSQAHVNSHVQGRSLALCEILSPRPPRKGQVSQQKSLVERRTPSESLVYEEPGQTEDRTERRSRGVSSDPVSSNANPSTVLDNNSHQDEVPRATTRKRPIASYSLQDIRPSKRTRTGPSKKNPQKKYSNFRAQLVNARTSKQQPEPCERPLGRNLQGKIPGMVMICPTIHDVSSKVTALDRLREQLGDESEEIIAERWERAYRIYAEVPIGRVLDLTSAVRKFKSLSCGLCRVQSEPSQPGSLRPSCDPQPERSHTLGVMTTVDLQRHLEDGVSPENSSRVIHRAIKALDQDVVNKIAAGEVIVSPVDALKELIENALDAGSTSVIIKVNKSDLTSFEIADNGHGIRKEDLPILCQKSTTSKLTSIKDLLAISTNGFRGEALASISQVAFLTVTARTEDSALAWRSEYTDGKLIATESGQSATPTHGQIGTRVKVDSLFHGCQVRRRACQSKKDLPKLTRMIERYAVHHASVQFFYESNRTPRRSFATRSHMTFEAIQDIYGADVAKIRFLLSRPGLGLIASGWISDTQYHGKQTIFLLFINDRLVESTAIKRGIRDVYAKFLANGHHPFSYLSLKIDPSRIDVNVHPRKLEVSFLNEDQTIAEICTKIETQLVASQLDCRNHRTSPTRENPPSRDKETHISSEVSDNSPTETILDQPGNSHIRNYSISRLRKGVDRCKNMELATVLSSSSRIGVIDPCRHIFAIRSGSGVHLIAADILFREAFYQIGIASFPNFDTLNFNPPLDICNLVSLAAESPDDTSFQGTPQTLTQALVSMEATLVQHFGFKFSRDGKIVALPLLAKRYIPSLARLPRFLRRLAYCVDIPEEHVLFETVLRELAILSVPSENQVRWTTASNTGIRSDTETTDTRGGAGSATGYMESQGGVLKAEILLEYLLKHIKGGRLVPTMSMATGVDEVRLTL